MPQSNTDHDSEQLSEDSVVDFIWLHIEPCDIDSSPGQKQALRQKRHYVPDDIFTTDDLETWAKGNGWTRV